MSRFPDPFTRLRDCWPQAAGPKRNKGWKGRPSWWTVVKAKLHCNFEGGLNLPKGLLSGSFLPQMLWRLQRFLHRTAFVNNTRVSWRPVGTIQRVLRAHLPQSDCCPSTNKHAKLNFWDKIKTLDAPIWANAPAQSLNFNMCTVPEKVRQASAPTRLWVYHILSLNDAEHSKFSMLQKDLLKRSLEWTQCFISCQF